MPYIKKEKRERIDNKIFDIVNEIKDSGDLCYLIYKLLVFITVNYGISFKIMSSLISEVECAKLEFYRRIVAPYEDEKIKENGDI